MSNIDLGYWTLPKPDVEVKEWNRIPRVARTIPFGYEVDPEDADFLLPIKDELDALEQAKDPRHDQSAFKDKKKNDKKSN